MFLQLWVPRPRVRLVLRTLAAGPAQTTDLLFGFSQDASGSVYHFPGMGVPHSYQET